VMSVACMMRSFAILGIRDVLTDRSFGKSR
jgi:hypothetical protein